MNSYAQAIAGNTVFIPFADMWIKFPNDNSGFADEAALQAWCTTFGLQYEYLPTNQTYKISKLQ